MKGKFLLIALLFMVNISFAQTFDVTKNDKGLIFKSPPRPDSLSALIIVNKKHFKESAFLTLIPPDEIEDVKVMNAYDARLAYGESVKNGALIIEVKKHVKWITLNQVFRSFKILKQHRNLDVMIEGKKVLDKDGFVVGKNWVKAVRIVENTNPSADNKQYISLSR